MKMLYPSQEKGTLSTSAIISKNIIVKVRKTKLKIPVNHLKILLICTLGLICVSSLGYARCVLGG
jgi:hypothetical protein